MRKFLTLAISGIAALALSSPAAAQTSFDSLLGDMDCFGTGAACVEDGTTWVPTLWGGISADASDPAFTDRLFNTSATTSWTHSFMAGSWSSAFLTFRTAGIADIAGPYDVFVDGVLVGSMPLDGYGHILAETFTFGLAPSLVADGSATVSFTSDAADSWAIDYARISGSSSEVVPEPISLALLGTGLLGVAGVAVRRRREDEIES